MKGTAPVQNGCPRTVCSAVGAPDLRKFLGWKIRARNKVGTAGCWRVRCMTAGRALPCLSVVCQALAASFLTSTVSSSVLVQRGAHAALPAATRPCAVRRPHCLHRPAASLHSAVAS
jgi:hypothetical protein